MIRDAILISAKKTDKSQLKEPKTKKRKRTKKYEQTCSEVSVNSPGNSWSQS